MKYKDYIGEVKYSDKDKIFHGRVVNVAKDIISFEGRTVDELEEDFKRAVDFYLEMLKERGEKPEKPFFGKFFVSLTEQDT